MQSRYDYSRISIEDHVRTTDQCFQNQLELWVCFENKNTGCYRYYNSSCNCCGRYLDEPSLITNRDEFDEFLECIKQNDILQWVISQRPDSQWICEIVTNVTFFINQIVNHPIGCVSMNPLPTYIKKNKAVIGLEREPINGKRYNDNLCLFRCLALHRGGVIWNLPLRNFTRRTNRMTMYPWKNLPESHSKTSDHFPNERVRL